MKNEIMVNGFSAVSENEILDISGGFTSAQWITGACVVAGAVVGTVLGGPVCTAIGVKTGSAVGIAICAGLGIATGAVAGVVAYNLCN